MLRNILNVNWFTWNFSLQINAAFKKVPSFGLRHGGWAEGSASAGDITRSTRSARRYARCSASLFRRSWSRQRSDLGWLWTRTLSQQGSRYVEFVHDGCFCFCKKSEKNAAWLLVAMVAKEMCFIIQKYKYQLTDVTASKILNERFI